MGLIAEGILAYMQPLIAETDGSPEQLEKALAIGQACYNLASLPEDERDWMLRDMKWSMKMDDEQFDDFKNNLVLPMIRRHEAMFPLMHQRSTPVLSHSGPVWNSTAKAPKPYTGTDRYAPCPCGSGRKYKFCCGKTGR